MENEKNEIISEGNERREEVKEEKEEGEEENEIIFEELEIKLQNIFQIEFEPYYILITNKTENNNCGIKLELILVSKYTSILFF